MRLLFAAFFVTCCWADVSKEKENAKKFIDEFNRNAKTEYNKWLTSIWNYYNNFSAENLAMMTEAEGAYSSYIASQKHKAKKLNFEGLSSLDKRHFKLLLNEAPISQNQDVAKKTLEVKSKWIRILNTNFQIDSQTVKSVNSTVPNGVLKTSHKPEELQYAWEGQRKFTNSTVGDLFNEYATLKNQAAKEDGLKDYSEYLGDRFYEVKGIEKIADKLWTEMKPLYKELHAYARYKLSEKFPKVVEKDGLIPAHLMANYQNIYQMIKPYGK